MLYCNTYQRHLQEGRTLPLPWFGRIVGREGDAGFRYLNDPFLCHLTGVPNIQLFLFDPRQPGYPWQEFDPTKRYYWGSDAPMILKAGGMEASDCIGLAYLICKVYDCMANVTTYGKPPVIDTSDEGKDDEEFEASDSDKEMAEAASDASDDANDGSAEPEGEIIDLTAGKMVTEKVNYRVLPNGVIDLSSDSE
jgi:hypothetical protein